MKTRRLISLTMIFIFSFAAFSIAAANKDKDKDAITIVLDPGHGGKDFGACENGAKEKDINLSVAKKLRDMIEKELKDVKVVRCIFDSPGTC